MKFLDLRNDWAFKRVFGSRESAGVLRGFLNDTLHDGKPVIESVEILDPYLPSQLHKMKNSAVDVRARTGAGAEALIEMQMHPVAGYGQRVLYNGAKSIVSQLGRSARYDRIRPVTVISVLDFIYWKERPAQWFSRYAMREEKGHRWTAGGLDLVFMELPKVDSRRLPEGHPLRDWVALLKNAPQWHSIPRIIKNSAVREAITLASHDSLTPTESEKMSRRQLYQMDQINIRRFAREEGLEEGRVAGRVAGREEGRVAALREVAAAALSRGSTVKDVAALTGLSLREIRALRPAIRPRSRKLQPA